MDNELDSQEVLNPEENQDSNLDESAAEARLKKAEEIAKNQKIRAEKAEKELKALKNKSEEKKTPENEYSLKDIRALASIHDDDVDRVVKFAKSEGITIAEAKSDPIMKIYLREQEESRKSAEAANTGGGARGTSATTDEDLLDQLEKGELPEEDIPAAVQARLKKLSKKGT